MKAKLVLENGDCYEGISIGSPGERIGEVVLNTAVVGYQEMMTDPANAGKILVLTYPLIGNYGVASKFNESRRCWLSALVIKEASRIYSNYQAEGSFKDFLKKEDVLTVSEVDTRTLAVDIRDNGEMLGIVSTENTGKEGLLKKIKAAANYKKDYIKDISVKKPAEIKSSSSGPDIAILDIGMLNSFIKQLKTLGCNLTLLPYDTPADDIKKSGADGLIISGGPENDVSLPKVSETVKSLLGKIPMLGISTGHEVIATALGAKLKKLGIGHHGVNYPAKSPDRLKGEITVQNHSFVVDGASVKGRKDITITSRNVNDGSIEGMESRSLKFISCQYYPASPGFDEVNEIYRRFLKTLSGVRHAKA
ncbi:MAG: glutamine-hydrolyzing carbamoyl-phosphate synthase small subunit [Candidatus Omnitrophica bacterium]|nr:glutamine-hydrolyzing carbamoyl-phosphate synthase small subunit [Candidatus Omnitrophota bacterium]